MLKLIRVVAAVTMFILATPDSFAADACPTCSGEVQYPEAEAFLGAHGYPASQYTVLMSWSERTVDGSGRFVTGYHLRPANGGTAFDLYSDGAGLLLTDDQLKSLGVKPKNWDLPPAEKMAELPKSVQKALPEKPVPVGIAKSVEPRGGQVLPEIDWAQVAREDKEHRDQGKGASRIGVFVDLEEPVTVVGEAVSSGAWAAVPGGGSLWSFAMLSPDALGMRVHFNEIQLPLGARVVVYNGDDATEAYGPYLGPAPNETDLWSATVFSESVVVECFVPAGIDRNAVRIGIDRVTHNYVPFADLAMSKAAGACNLDASCYTQWSFTAAGVAGIGSIGGSGSLWCTGSLLADTDEETDIPYFLTANHCVGSQSGASNIEAYWLYQATSCGGSVPNPSSVPRTTGGAQLLATTNASSGTDFVLLRLNNDPPDGISFLGWSSSEAAVGTPDVCIHHPSGDYKRITFGDVTNVAQSLLSSRPRERYHQTTWRTNLGVTEPGSSGSPLFIESTQQVIGQLWGGPSSCTAAEKMDYYGRFDVSFPLIESYLDPNTTVDGTIEVTVPNSSKNWPRGEKRKIKWVTTGNPGATVKIDLYRNGLFVSHIKASTPNDGKCPWKIPMSLSTGGNYFVRVISTEDVSILDNSDSFSIK